MSTAIATVPRQVAGLTPQSIEQAQDIAEKLAASTLVPDHFRGKPADCFMAIAYGAELGMAPVTALASIAVVKGKPTLYAQTMVALVMQSGKAIRFQCVESDGNSATYETLRVNADKPRRYTFTQADAKAAGLAGGMYNKYPKQMLEARAKGYLAKDVYPDVLHGMSSAEEIQEIPEQTRAANTVDFVAPEPAPEPAPVEHEANVYSSDLVLAIESAATSEALESLLPQLRELAGEERDYARIAYKDKKEALA